MTRPVLAGALGLALLATGCTEQPGDHYADATDLARAERVWADPWAAPVPELVEATYGSNAQVSRRVGTRTTAYADWPVLAAARAEATAARAAGWALTGASCADAEVALVLTRGTGELDTTAAAEVTVEPGEARIEVAVPHHVDGSWPDLGPAMDIADSCLGGGADQKLPDVPFSGEPIDGRESDEDAPSWSDDGPDAAEEAIRAAIESDAWFLSTGVRLPSPPHDAGDQQRSAGAVVGVATPGPDDPRRSLAAVVSSMNASGWETTWASCGAGVTASATLRLVADGVPATVRLTAAPGSAGEVAWQLTPPIVDGPDAGWVTRAPVLETSACLGSAPPTRMLVTEGTPVSLPTSLQPVRS